MFFLNPNKRLSRRTLLRGAGTIAIALPFLEAMGPRSGFATPASQPRRFLGYITPNGTVPDLYFPDPATAGGAFELGPMLQPLQRHKDQLSMVLGLDHPHGEGHEGTTTLLTGVAPLIEEVMTKNGDIKREKTAGGISLDQHIANRLAAAPGTQTPFSSLVLGTNRNSHVYSGVSFAGPKTRVQKKYKAGEIFDTLFAGGDSEHAAKLRAMRRSVLDSVGDDLTKLQGQLGSEDRARLEHHLTAVREVERRLGSVAQCSTEGYEFGQGSFSDSAWLDNVMPQVFGVLALAFACDMTRVSTLMVRNEGQANKWAFGWLVDELAAAGVDPPAYEPVRGEDLSDSKNGYDSHNHHTLSHHDYGQRNRAYLTVIMQYFMRELATFVDRLKEIPEGDGTVFDNTVILHSSPIALGNHKAADMPVTLLGSAGGALKTGQFLKLWKDNGTTWPVADGKTFEESGGINRHGTRSSHYRGRSYNDLLVTLLHAMGFTDEATFGDPERCDGPIGELLA